MEYRKFGAAGVKVSAIGLGGNNFGRRIDAAQTAAVVHRALDLGVNLFDTADMYGPFLSEEYLGKALAGRRHEVVLATKGGKRLGDKPNEIGLSYRRVMACCENSLRRLGTDHVDVYYLHEPDSFTRPDETLRACDDLVRQGKVRYIGISNYRAWQACEMLWACDRRGYQPPVVTQDLYNLLDRDVEADLVPFCRAHGIGIVPYYPLASSLLSGKFRRGDPIPTEVRGMRLPVILKHLNPGTFETIWRLDAFAKELGHSLSEMAIAWLLSHSEVPSVIAGASKPEQVEANVAACEWKLSADELKGIEGILASAGKD